jgi:hypothetical protein
VALRFVELAFDLTRAGVAGEGDTELALVRDEEGCEVAEEGKIGLAFLAVDSGAGSEDVAGGVADVVADDNIGSRKIGGTNRTSLL